MARVRTPPPNVDDREVAARYAVVAIVDGERVTSAGMTQKEADTYAAAMNQANPSWRATVKKQ